jgi:hypothetical protein
MANEDNDSEDKTERRNPHASPRNIDEARQISINSEQPVAARPTTPVPPKPKR